MCNDVKIEDMKAGMLVSVDAHDWGLWIAGGTGTVVEDGEPLVRFDEPPENDWGDRELYVNPECVHPLVARSDVDFIETSVPETSGADMVHQPKHYTAHPKGIEAIDVIEDCPYPNIANALRYPWRSSWGGKWDDLEDLRKAHNYVGREIERRKAIADPETYAIGAVSWRETSA